MRLPLSLREVFTNSNVAKQARSTVADYSERAGEYIKAKASEGSHAIKNAVKEKATAASDKASSLAQETGEFVKQKVTQGSIAVTRTASEKFTATSNAVSRLPRESSEYVKKRVVEGTNAATNAASEQISAASNAASKKFHSSFGDFRSAGDRALRWLWWWSLAAIGVYGVATTVPKELIRQYAAKSLEKQPEKEDQEP